MELCEWMTAYPVLLIPLSYIIYRLSRVCLALVWAIFLYWLAPLIYSPNLKRYRMRWCVVSGSTDGIGKAYTLELARRGLRKFVLVGRSEEKLAKVKAELEELHADCSVRTLLFDFSDGDFASLRSQLADVDVGLAVNSVGIGRKYMERFADTPEADSQILRVNGLGAAEFLSCVLPPMEAHGGGRVVTLASVLGLRPNPLLAAYSASKAMMVFLGEAIDREYRTISVQTLTPALVATKMTYYTHGGLFVVTPEAFARQALLLHHLFPWSVLKHVMMIINLYHQKRVLRVHGKPMEVKEETKEKGEEVDKPVEITKEILVEHFAGNGDKKGSKIPTNVGVNRSRA